MFNVFEGEYRPTLIENLTKRPNRRLKRFNIFPGVDLTRVIGPCLQLRWDGKLRHCGGHWADIFTFRKTFLDRAWYLDTDCGYLHEEVIKGAYEINEQEKKRRYNDRIVNVEHGYFTPLGFSCYGGMSHVWKCYSLLSFFKTVTYFLMILCQCNEIVAWK